MIKTVCRLVPLISLILTSFLFTSAVLANRPDSSYDSSYPYKFMDKHAKSSLEQISSMLISEGLNTRERYFLTHNLGYSHFRLNNKKQAIATLSQSIELAKALDAYHQAKSLQRRALTYGILLRDTDTAIIDLEKALALISSSRHQDSNTLHFDLLTSMSQAFNQKAELVQAKNYIEQALELVQKPKDKEDKIYALIILGRILWQQNKIADATQAFLDALQLTDANTSRARLAALEQRLAVIYSSRKVLDLSLSHAKKAVELYNEIKRPRLQINAMRVLANIHLELGKDINQAIMHYLNALDIAKQIDAPHATGELQHLIGKAYIQEGNLESAEKYLNQAEKTLAASEEKYYVGLNVIEQARLMNIRGKTAASVEMLKQLLSSDKLNAYPQAVYEARELLVTGYQKLGMFKQAYQLQGKQLEYQKEALAELEASSAKQLSSDIEIKTLSNQLASLKQQDKDKTQEVDGLKTKTSLFHYALLISAILVGSLMWRLIRQHKHLLKQKKHNQDFEPYFWRQIKNRLNQENRAKQAGLLVSFPHITAENDINRQQGNQLIDDWHNALQQAQTPRLQLNHHHELWMYCDKQPDIRQLLKCQQPQQGLVVKLVWLSFDDLPEHISDDTLAVVEKIIFKAGCEFKSGQAIQWTSIEIKEHALAMIYSNRPGAENAPDINHGLERAYQAGMVEFTDIS